MPDPSAQRPRHKSALLCKSPLNVRDVGATSIAGRRPLQEPFVRPYRSPSLPLSRNALSLHMKLPSERARATLRKVRQIPLTTDPKEFDTPRIICRPKLNHIPLLSYDAPPHLFEFLQATMRTVLPIGPLKRDIARGRRTLHGILHGSSLIAGTYCSFGKCTDPPQPFAPFPIKGIYSYKPQRVYRRDMPLQGHE